jgi:hypothetical protein
MSVAPGLEALLLTLPTYVPKRLRRLSADPRMPESLRTLAAGASGSNSLWIWQHGTGPFEDSYLTDLLELRTDSAEHGVVGPRIPMDAPRYQAALHATRERWSLVEEAE